MEILYTSKNEEILVSDEDYSLLSRHNWHLNQGYALTKIGVATVFMHKLIQPTGKNKFVDHINRIKTDNRRENLRVVTQAENNYNTARQKGKEGFIGVYRHKRGNYLFGAISHKNKIKHLPRALDRIDAAKMRDYVCWQMRGEYSILNFPDIDYTNFAHAKKNKLDAIVSELKKI